MKFRFPLSLPRRDDRTALPATLCVLLFLLALAQLAMTGAGDPPAEAEGRVNPAGAFGAVRFATPSPMIMERPIFSPTRRNGNQPAVAGGALGGAIPVGVVSRGGAARLFLKLPDGSVKTLSRGGSYMGWRLATLTGEGATFAQGGQRMTVAFGSTASQPSNTPDDDEDAEEN